MGASSHEPFGERNGQRLGLRPGETLRHFGASEATETGAAPFSGCASHFRPRSLA